MDFGGDEFRTVDGMDTTSKMKRVEAELDAYSYDAPVAEAKCSWVPLDLDH